MFSQWLRLMQLQIINACLASRKHTYIILTHLNLAFTGVYNIFLISAQNQKYEKYQISFSENFYFFGGEIFNIFE